ncbi:MAG: Acetyl-CoA synthetase [Bartonella clarridgeiae]|nr:MAG: Acetyl-CoA synthetase [Bartonella clarridgeiae]
MSEKTYPVPTHLKKNAFINHETHRKWYQQSLNDPEAFWAKHG